MVRNSNHELETLITDPTRRGRTAGYSPSLAYPPMRQVSRKLFVTRSDQLRGAGHLRGGGRRLARNPDSRKLFLVILRPGQLGGGAYLSDGRPLSRSSELEPGSRKPFLAILRSGQMGGDGRARGGRQLRGGSQLRGVQLSSHPEPAWPTHSKRRSLKLICVFGPAKKAVKGEAKLIGGDAARDPGCGHWSEVRKYDSGQRRSST